MLSKITKRLYNDQRNFNEIRNIVIGKTLNLNFLKSKTDFKDELGHTAS